jgi:hypothetical protein
MSRGADIPKRSPESVARGLPDRRGGGHLLRSRLRIPESWRRAAKVLERRFAAFAEADVKS